MDIETFDATIRSFKNRTPFRPFTVSLVNGERLEVDYPDALVVRDGVAVFVAPGGIPCHLRSRGRGPSGRGLGEPPARIDLRVSGVSEPNEAMQPTPWRGR